MFGQKLPSHEYTLKRFKSSKSLKLRIRPDGELLVTAPLRLPKRYIDNFICEQTKWIDEKKAFLDSLPEVHIKTKKGDYEKYKEQARAIIKIQLEKINSHYKFEYKNISIRDQKTRWGSCSARKNLSFNYKVVFIPEKFIAYIVAHELCHLTEMNHGPNFWRLVNETIPDYKNIQKELHTLRI